MSNGNQSLNREQINRDGCIYQWRLVLKQRAKKIRDAIIRSWRSIKQRAKEIRDTYIGQWRLMLK